MKQAPSLARLKALFSFDEATGVFTRREASNRHKSGPVASKPNPRGYTTLHFDGVTYRQHRLAYYYVTGIWPDGPIDHQHGIRGNNTLDEIRAVTTKVNAQNRRTPNRNNSTGFLGVSKKVWKGRLIGYVARICVDGKLKQLGRFSNPAEAHTAYVSAKRVYHEGNTL